MLDGEDEPADESDTDDTTDEGNNSSQQEAIIDLDREELDILEADDHGEKLEKVDEDVVEDMVEVSLNLINRYCW